MTKEEKQRVAQLLEDLEKDFLAEEDEHGLSWINGRIEELAQLTTDEWTGTAIIALADTHYEHSLIAQTFYTEQVAQLRRERGEL